MTVLLMATNATVNEYAEFLAKTGFPSEVSLTYAQGLLAVQEDFEKLPQTKATALMETLMRTAKEYPEKPLVVLEVFQDKLREILNERQDHA
jgi:hypothetical protein